MLQILSFSKLLRFVGTAFSSDSRTRRRRALMIYRLFMLLNRNLPELYLPDIAFGGGDLSKESKSFFLSVFNTFL